MSSETRNNNLDSTDNGVSTQISKNANCSVGSGKATPTKLRLQQSDTHEDSNNSKNIENSKLHCNSPPMN